MDGIANVAKEQQSQINIQQSAQAKGSQRSSPTEQTKQVDVVKEIQKENSNTDEKINSKEDIQELVEQLNNAMSPISTNIRFGVDKDDIFYVSVIEEKTDRMIRRFPAEQAVEFLPKMQEVVGILFDSKG